MHINHPNFTVQSKQLLMIDVWYSSIYLSTDGLIKLDSYGSSQASICACAHSFIKVQNNPDIDQSRSIQINPGINDLSPSKNGFTI